MLMVTKQLYSLIVLRAEISLLDPINISSDLKSANSACLYSYIYVYCSSCDIILRRFFISYFL